MSALQFSIGDEQVRYPSVWCCALYYTRSHSCIDRTEKLWQTAKQKTVAAERASAKSSVEHDNDNDNSVRLFGRREKLASCRVKLFAKMVRA